MGYNQQALYCYRKVYSLDPANVHALWERAVLAKNIGEFSTVTMVTFRLPLHFSYVCIGAQCLFGHS